MKVLIACEFSGIVRDAFLKRGHNAWSCDLIPTESTLGNGQTSGHLVMDVRRAIGLADWDMMIAHPPCTHLAVSGARWFKEKLAEQAEALDFVRMLMAAPIKRIAIENPISIISSRIRKPDQIIQPWQFGHGEIKSTCLWLQRWVYILLTTWPNHLAWLNRGGRIVATIPQLKGGRCIRRLLASR